MKPIRRIVLAKGHVDDGRKEHFPKIALRLPRQMFDEIAAEAHRKSVPMARLLRTYVERGRGVSDLREQERVADSVGQELDRLARLDRLTRRQI
jgi:hypothetical protein